MLTLTKEDDLTVQICPCFWQNYTPLTWRKCSLWHEWKLFPCVSGCLCSVSETAEAACGTNVVSMMCFFLPLSFPAGLPLSPVHFCVSVRRSAAPKHTTLFTAKAEECIPSTPPEIMRQIPLEWSSAGTAIWRVDCALPEASAFDFKVDVKYCYLLSEWRCLDTQLETNGHELLVCRWRVRDPFSLTALWSCGMWEAVWHRADDHPEGYTHVHMCR